ncbi:unnamed protein product [Trichogramma brassicae]|uniref:Uncharacterized protein n=1 Tax=Trichogramma brassicae TaxID=86971 RepID=A0A6H5I942_9HYME|nr:unnamed protein product [Trichogramma brassicae]
MNQREAFIKQLQPSRRPIDCLHVRLLGHCASGKSSLVNSLRAGIFNFGFFKRAKNQNQNTKRDPSIELDVTTKHESLSFEHSDNEYESTIGIEISRGNVGEQQILFKSYSPLDVQVHFKNGQLLGLSGGECVFWEFCGREDYLVSYHRALMAHQPMQVNLITISLRQPLNVQIQQARFWLRFIADRIRPNNIGFAGKCADVQVILVGTYAPEPPIGNNTNGKNLLEPLLASLKEFIPLLGEEFKCVALDATSPSCPGLKQLRAYLNQARGKCFESSHDLSWSGLMEAWRAHTQSLENPPMMLDLKGFVREVRLVNPLVSVEHCKHLAEQLQAFGECLILPGDLYVLSLEWLWRDAIGWQLNPDQKNRLGFRTTGVYTAEDFQARCPCPANQALQVLQAFHLCVPVQLRKTTQSWNCQESDLYQWWRGSKLCLGPCECIVTLEEEEQGCIQVWVRGPRGTGAQCFNLLGIVLDAVDSALDIVAPGMLLERHCQSPSQLRDYDEQEMDLANEKVEANEVKAKQENTRADMIYDEVRDLEKKLVQMEKDFETSKEVLDAQTAELERVEKAYTKVLEERNRLDEERMEKLTNELKDARLIAEDADQKSDDISTKLSLVEEAAEAAEERVKTSEAKIIEREDELFIVQNIVKSLVVSEEKANARVADMKEQLKELKKRLKEAEKRAILAERTVKKLLKDVDFKEDREGSGDRSRRCLRAAGQGGLSEGGQAQGSAEGAQEETGADEGRSGREQAAAQRRQCRSRRQGKVLPHDITIAMHLSQVQSELAMLNRKMQQCVENLEKTEERRTVAQTKLAQALHTCEDAKRMCKNLENRSKLDEERMESLMSQLKEARYQAEDADNKSEQISRQLALVEDELESVEDRVKLTEAQIAEKENKLFIVGNILKSLEVSEEKANQRVDIFKSQLKHLKARLKETEKRAVFAEKSVKSYVTELDMREERFVNRVGIYCIWFTYIIILLIYARIVECPWVSCIFVAILCQYINARIFFCIMRYLYIFE